MLSSHYPFICRDLAPQREGCEGEAYDDFASMVEGENYDDFASMMEDHAGRAGNVMPRGPSQRPPTHFGRLSLRLSQTAARDRKAAGVKK